MPNLQEVRMADKNSAETATKAAKLAVNVEDKKAAAQAEVDALVRKAQKALAEFEKLDQQAVDRIVAKASVAALNKHLVLAKLAVDETGRGLVEDKATKNIFACEHVTNYMAGQKTVGIIREDDVLGIDEVAEPVGVVAGVTPGDQPDVHCHLQVAHRPQDPLPDCLRLPPGSAEELRRSGAHRA